MSRDSGPYLVQALYTFKGKNNDELCFKKGDIITVTQREEGGWWEGTLGEKTGWFPSNYVKEYKLQDGRNSLDSGKTSPSKLPPEVVAQQKAYRNLVLKDLIESEKAHVAELQGLLKNFLHPLEKSDILTRDEYRQLVGNIGNVVESHQQVLASLEECSQRPALEQRVGKVFLSAAPRIKQVHQAYCASHPRAVCVLDKFKDELNTFMEAQGAASPGLLVLTTGLSKPFRRLEKYAGMLQELERHVEENHPDRGDTQRSVSVYKDIASACSSMRRQKELELEVLTGGVRGWEGEDLSCLGEILHMGSVAVGPDHMDRYLVLFPTTLLMLSVSQRMSAFIYEGKLPLTGITVSKLDDSDTYKNAFEVTGPMIERILAVCQTRNDQQAWVEQLKLQIRSVRKSPATSPPPGKPQPLPPPHVSLPAASPYAHLTAYFANLVKKGVITRTILKNLLYLEFSSGKVSILGVKLRRNHKVECVIFPRPTSVGNLTSKRTWIKSSTTDTDSEEDTCSAPSSSSETDSPFLRRQDAVDLSSDEEKSSFGSCASNPFGYIHYYSPTCLDNLQKSKVLVSGTSSTHYNKGSNNNDNIYKPTEYKSSATLNITCAKKKEDKILAYQNSSLSDESSFERTSKPFPNTFCEDLTKINKDSSRDSSGLPSHQNLFVPHRHSIDLRQSLPPRFPLPHNTMKIPPFQSSNTCMTSQEAHLNSNNSLSHSLPLLPLETMHPTTTHSSILNIPANTIPVPCAMMAELLYNLEPLYSKTSVYELTHQQESASSDKSVESVQTVKDRDLPPNTNITATESERHHNVLHTVEDILNLKTGKGEVDQHDEIKYRRKVPGRNYSYHYVSVVKSMCEDKRDLCRCCGNIPCSNRSSDSGLADITGNSTLPSPDLSSLLPDLDPGGELTSLGKALSIDRGESSEFDEANFEAQCVCTSPFGSTPRTSAQPSLTSEKVFVGSTDSVVPSVTSSCLAPSPVSTPQPWHDVPRNRGGIYRSGMYAHWWLKTKIPASATSAVSPPMCAHVSTTKHTPPQGNKGWSMSCLRPSPPLRPCLALGRDDSPRKSTRSYNRRQSDRTFEEDAQILRVIEAYCSSAKSRYTVNSGSCVARFTLLPDEFR
uniref:Rho guanine nucleotide exchange factor 7 n=1 Tax=Timema douglasi TaxID=61478 RepID=A0A7R8Z4K2_TIMDO|nr:unnamed protein product [Timema douglasi]